MKMSWHLPALVIVVSSWLCGTASGEEQITVVGGSALCVVDQGDRRVTIISSGTLILQAHDTVTGAPTDINVIELGSGVISGSVSVNVIGAHSLKQVDLYRTGVTSTITGLTLTGDLGEVHVLARYLTGTVYVGGDLRHAGATCTANVTVGGCLLGNVSGGNFNLTVNGSGTHTGLISAGSSGSPYAGTINFTNSSAAFSGYIWLDGGLTGSVTLAGNLLYAAYPNGMIHSSADVRGPIHVNGNLAGQISVGGALRNATLEEDPLAASAEITVGGNVTSTGAITVGTVAC
jgi:hypothetical protein